MASGDGAVVIGFASRLDAGSVVPSLAATAASDVRASGIQLSEPIRDDAELRLLAVVVPNRDADERVVKIGFAVERHRADDDRWESIMADLDDQADADNCARVEALFAITREEGGADELSRRATPLTDAFV